MLISYLDDPVMNLKRTPREVCRHPYDLIPKSKAYAQHSLLSRLTLTQYVSGLALLNPPSFCLILYLDVFNFDLGSVEKNLLSRIFHYYSVGGSVINKAKFSRISANHVHSGSQSGPKEDLNHRNNQIFVF